MMQAIMGKMSACFLGLALGLALSATGAQAKRAAPEKTVKRPALADNLPMPVFGKTSQPIGHYDFCRRYPKQCLAHGALAAKLRLTEGNLQRLIRVNAHFNKQIHAATDQEIYGKEEYWEYPDKAFNRGDCEDYALMKQRALEQEGIAAANLLITVVRKTNGEAHAVLTVRTDSGDYILDNLRDSVLDWRRTNYRYIKRQSAQNAGQWVALEPQQSAPLPAAALQMALREEGSLADSGKAAPAATRAIARKPAARRSADKRALAVDLRAKPVKTAP